MVDFTITFLGTDRANKQQKINKDLKDIDNTIIGIYRTFHKKVQNTYYYIVHVEHLTRLLICWTKLQKSSSEHNFLTTVRLS